MLGLRHGIFAINLHMADGISDAGHKSSGNETVGSVPFNGTDEYQASEDLAVSGQLLKWMADDFWVVHLILDDDQQ